MSVKNEFHSKYRPRKLKQVVGQDTAVKLLTSMKGKYPHALLFTGPSGTGKTTLARIIKDELGCSDLDYTEINAASARGVDTIREIAAKMYLAPMGGKCRVYCLDECFHGDTKVHVTRKEQRKISELSVGDTVLSITGEAIVEHVFHNEVPIDRIVLIELTDGSRIYTTIDHDFLTVNGWKQAGELTPLDSFFTMCCEPVTDLTHGEKDEDCEGVSDLQEVIHGDESWHEAAHLQQVVRWNPAAAKVGTWKDRSSEMRGMQQDVYGSELQSQAVLQSNVCGAESQPQTRVPCETLHEGSGGTNLQQPKRVLHDGEGGRSGCSVFRAYENAESWGQSQGSRENESYEDKERDMECLEGGTGRKWKADKAPKETSYSIGRQMGIGAGNSYEERSKVWFSKLLQSRPGAERFEDCDRSRRWRAYHESRYLARQEKDKTSRRVGVVSVTFYQPGSNDEQFAGVIGDKEKREGTATFYDLQVTGHPSYFVEGTPVHNCHRLTNDAQSALLKMLEDPPSSAYFMLATTDPQKLLPTIRTRCTTITCKSVNEPDLTKLATRIRDKEGLDISDTLIEKLVENADGSPRRLVVTLGMVVDLENEDDQIDAIERSDEKKQAIDLCRFLMRHRGPVSDWIGAAEIIKSIPDSEIESFRRMVLAYATSCLIGAKDRKPPKTPNKHAYQVILAFSDHFFDSGRAGLTAACCDVIFGE